MTGIPHQRTGGEPQPPYLGVRPAPLEWMRRRRAQRQARRSEAAGNRAALRLGELGPGWHLVEWPLSDLAEPAPDGDLAGFLVVGVGGVYAVTVVDHGRAPVLIAGDVVQVDGRRPPYVARARRDARHASRSLSAATGHEVPVVPVLAFVGSGRISTHGLPRGCLLTSYRELERLLLAGGDRISAVTADKLAQVARDTATWINRRYPDRGGEQDQQRPAAAREASVEK